MGLKARCSASTQNIVPLWPVWRQDSESAKGKKGGQEERVRQRKKSELNEVDEQHMNCS